MRIGLNATDQPSISAEQSKKSSTPATNQTDWSPAGDNASFSQDRVTLSSLATQAMGMPEVRQAQVDSLRQSVRSGQYQLDPNQIADSMLKG